MAAQALVENGATVYINARKADVCERVAAELTALGPGKCFALPADLTFDQKCVDLAKRLSEKESKLHVLVNNAGATWGAPSMEEFPENGWTKVMALNVYSIFNLTRACVPLLKAASGGNLDPSHVINIGSVAGVMASALDNAPSYMVSKAGVAHVTRWLAGNLCRQGICVNNIQPAVFPSKMTFDYQLRDEKAAEATVRVHPVGRYGDELDMAGMILYLSSRASAFVTGESICLDGGMANIRDADKLPLPDSKL
eukprot:gnl/MRDRNA2_/MRDRNA2_23424_c0_seq1.p1 gnl/MRDRNA2_/MRDRNA2_23424_c0~~gnl/MRDRNA2_/MRDRNA2_23424_c0_seq1.p1  ORF type:complete len:262 (+),score=62.53 gnl/MRDRNA2_/MRDRNA2_23424_c0_seq1:26-787(+)